MTDFDTQALRQAASIPCQSDPAVLASVWKQNAADLVAAADHIDALLAGIERVGMKVLHGEFVLRDGGRSSVLLVEHDDALAGRKQADA